MLKAGIYLLGLFIETSEEVRKNGDAVNYVTITTGGRKGAISIRYVPTPDKVDFFGECELGREVFLKVSVTGFKDAVYYSLEEIVPLRQEVA